MLKAKVKSLTKSKTFDLEMEEKMIRIAVLGYGTVGSGVVKVIQTNAKLLQREPDRKLK